jgi:anti-anti-sigma regulatory factor
MGESESVLRTAITALAEELVVNIILNLADVTAMDDAGLETIVECQSGLAHSEGDLKLLSPNSLSVTIPIVLKLYSALEIFKNEQDAVNSFLPERETRRYDVLKSVRGRKIVRTAVLRNEFASSGDRSRDRPPGKDRASRLGELAPNRFDRRRTTEGIAGC